MMSEAQEKIADKIARVLKQAEEFRRHGEDGSADAAMARVEDMLMRHSIEYAVVQARLDKSERVETIIKHVFTFKGIYKVPNSNLAIRVCRALGTVQLITNPGSTKSQPDELWVIGYESDITAVIQLFTSIQVQCLSALENWWRTVNSDHLTAMEKFKDRRQFMSAFAASAARRIEMARAALLQSKDSEPGTAIALRDRKTDVDNFTKNNFMTVPAKGPKLKPGGLSSHAAGTRAGANAVTGETQVSTSRRSIESSR